MDLFRKVVLVFEDAPNAWRAELYAEGYSQSEVGYHAHLVIQEGLAEGVDMRVHGDDGPRAVITSLTSAGHDFANIARDDDGWNKALSTIAQRDHISFQALKHLLANTTRPPVSDVQSSGSKPEASEVNQSSTVEKASQRARAKRGPKPDRATARAVVKIIESVASTDEWKNKLAEVCEALDSNEIPHPSRWPKRDLEIKNWSDAALLEPHLAIQAIEYRIKIANG